MLFLGLEWTWPAIGLLFASIVTVAALGIRRTAQRRRPREETRDRTDRKPTKENTRLEEKPQIRPSPRRRLGIQPASVPIRRQYEHQQTLRLRQLPLDARSSPIRSTSIGRAALVAPSRPSPLAGDGRGGLVTYVAQMRRRGDEAKESSRSPRPVRRQHQEREKTLEVRPSEREKVLSALTKSVKRRKRGAFADGEHSGSIEDEMNGNAAKRKRAEGQGVKRAAGTEREESHQKKSRDQRQSKRDKSLDHETSSDPPSKRATRGDTSKKSKRSVKFSAKDDDDDVVMKDVSSPPSKSAKSARKRPQPESTSSQTKPKAVASSTESGSDDKEKEKDSADLQQVFKSRTPVYSPGFKDAALRRRVPLHKDPKTPLELASQLKEGTKYSLEDIEHDRKTARERVDYLLGGSDDEEEEEEEEEEENKKEDLKEKKQDKSNVDVSDGKSLSLSTAKQPPLGKPSDANQESLSAARPGGTEAQSKGNTSSVHKEKEPSSLSRATITLTGGTGRTESPLQGISLLPKPKPSLSAQMNSSQSSGSTAPLKLNVPAQSEALKLGSVEPSQLSSILTSKPSSSSSLSISSHSQPKTAAPTLFNVATTSSSSSSSSSSFASPAFSLASGSVTPARTVSDSNQQPDMVVSPMDDSIGPAQSVTQQQAPTQSLLTFGNQSAPPASVQSSQVAGLFSLSTAGGQSKGGLNLVPSTSSNVGKPSSSITFNLGTTKAPTLSAASHGGGTFSFNQGNKQQPLAFGGQQQISATQAKSASSGLSTATKPFTFSLGTATQSTARSTASSAGAPTFSFAPVGPQQQRPSSSTGFTSNASGASQKPSVGFNFNAGGGISQQPQPFSFSSNSQTASPFGGQKQQQVTNLGQSSSSTTPFSFAKGGSSAPVVNFGGGGGGGGGGGASSNPFSSTPAPSTSGRAMARARRRRGK